MELIPLSEFEKRYPWPSATALRGWRERLKGRVDGIFYRCGSRILIDPEAFFNYVKSNPDSK